MVSRKQIKHAIEVLQEATDEDFAEVKKQLASSLRIAKKLMQESDKKVQALVKDQGKSQSLFGFTEKYVADLDVAHPKSVSQFITNWCQRQSDWRYPWCWLVANAYEYVHLSVKSHLVYVCTNHTNLKAIRAFTKEKIAKTEHANPQMFRVKPLQFTGHISDFDVPHNQIGSLIALDLLPYYSLEQIDNLIKSCQQVLRPGGQALLHFSDADGEIEWQKFIDHKITFCTEEFLKDTANKYKLHCQFFHIDTMYSFVVITKPGDKISIKANMTKIEPYTKPTPSKEQMMTMIKEHKIKR